MVYFRYKLLGKYITDITNDYNNYYNVIGIKNI